MSQLRLRGQLLAASAVTSLPDANDDARDCAPCALRRSRQASSTSRPGTANRQGPSVRRRTVEIGAKRHYMTIRTDRRFLWGVKRQKHPVFETRPTLCER
jgi:hypothetical protein